MRNLIGALALIVCPGLAYAQAPDIATQLNEAVSTATTVVVGLRNQIVVDQAQIQQQAREIDRLKAEVAKAKTPDKAPGAP